MNKNNLGVDERVFRISFMFRRIIVPFDGSESSLVALDMALELSRTLGSHVTVAYACEDENEAKNVLEKAVERAREKGLSIETKVLKVGNDESVASVILREINRGGYDLVVMGARGKSYYEDLRLGSIASAVVMNSSKSFFIIR